MLVDLAGLAHADHRAVLRRDRAVGLHQHPAAWGQPVAEQSQQPERALDTVQDPEAVDEVEALVEPV